MNWVVPLVGRGGPAVSRCGHETRRHRVRGALFASVFASVLLAACGGGSGGNLTTSFKTEPGPPGPGPLTATGGGDGQGSESENEQQQQKIIVNQEEEQEKNNNEEQQQITVNVQPDPEESESEEQEKESEEEEEQQQQLTIIEEEDFPYVPPEEEEPRYSAQTQTQTQTSSLPAPDPTVIDSSFNCMDSAYVIDDCTSNVGPRSSSFTGTTINYTLENSAWTPGTFTDLKGKDRGLQASSVARNVAFNPANNNYNFDYKNINRLKKVEVTYSKTNGFEGFYTYKGTAYGSSTATQKDDVTLKATFYNEEVDPPFTIEGSIGGSDGLTIGSTNFGNITFTTQGNGSGQFTGTNISFSNSNIRTEAGFNEVKGSFKNDGSSSNFPSQVVGELKMRRFFDQSPDKSSDEYRSNLYLRGENAIAGVFLADRGNEVVTGQDIFYVHPGGDLFGFDYWGDITGGSSYPLTFNFGSQIMDNLDLENRGKIAFPHPLPAKYYELQTRLSQPNLYDYAEAEQAFDNYKNSIAYKSATKGVKNITAHYNGKVGGMYLYKGQPGSFESNVSLSVHLNLQDRRNQDNLLQYTGASISGHIGTDITMGGDTFYGFIVSHSVDTETGRFSAEKPIFGFRYGGVDGNVTPNVDHGTGTINGWFSNDGRKGTSKNDMPTQLFGKIEVSGFSKNGESGEGNQLKAIFVTER